MKRLFVVVCCLCVGGALATAQARPAASAVPTVTWVEGTLTIDGKAAAVGDTVPAGALLVTGALSLAEIEFNGRNVIKLAEKTTFLFDPGNLARGSVLRAGALALVLKQLVPGANGQGFRVSTASAVAGVRGTSFYIKVESPTSTYVCTCNGDVQVLDGGGSGLRDLASSHHAAAWITSTSPGVATIRDAPLLYHTDEEMDQLAAVIGYAIDWTVVDK